MGYMFASGLCLMTLIGVFVYESRRLKKEERHYRVLIDELLRDSELLSHHRRNAI